MSARRSDRVRVLIALAATLAVLRFVPDSRAAIAPLALTWLVAFYPLHASELIAWVIAAVFFLFQNYMSLSAGLFEFRDQDILLMPYYEPLLWGFYFTSLKRFVSGREEEGVTLGWRSVVGLVVTSAAFALFSSDPGLLLIVTSGSTAFLFLLFHAPRDVAYAVSALALGFIIEIFGVSTGLWSYPAADFLGIPYWFVTMWVSAGLLGRRVLIPLAQWVSRRLARQSA